MDNDSFHVLALRVMADPATDASAHSALETELAASPARREEFEKLKATHDLLRTTAPMAQATQALTPGLPAHRIGELRTAVRQHFGPVAQRRDAGSTAWAHILRWVFGGGGLAALSYALVIFCFANRTIEVGLYGSDLDLVRGDQGLTAADLSAAQLVTFQQDAPFDLWQNEPLAWNEHAKIWIDNERDLIHVIHRVRHGQVVTETHPLAPTPEAEREQIKQLVQSLQP